MTLEKIKYKDGSEREKLVLNPEEDNCPLCDTPLKNVGFTWAIFHGEAKSSCCGNIFQLKSYSVDEEKQGKEAVDFAESLDKPERIQCKIDGEYLTAYKKAFEELGVKQVSNEDVQKRVGELLNLPLK